MSNNSELSDRIVCQYLSKKGYKNAEQILRQEARVSTQPLPPSAVANHILFYNEDENNSPNAYESCYIKLRSWINDSIDLYKLELRRILFPLFVHAFLDLIAKGSTNEASEFLQKFKSDHHEQHLEEITRLSSIVDPRHLNENLIAKNFRSSKYGVKMCKYSFELLLYFLQDNKFMLLLRLINQYINIESSSEKPGADDDNAGTGLVGDFGSSGVDSFNQQEVKLGSLPPDLAFLSDMERYLAADVHILIYLKFSLLKMLMN